MLTKTGPQISEYRELLINKNYLHNSTSAPYYFHKKTNQALVSIITISRNSENTIKKTIESVLSQTYSNIEYIIIDGASSDSTLKNILTYKSKISYLISEPDNGISDAFNKGISVANGDIVGIINSDDWYQKHAVEKIANAYSEHGEKIFFGNLVFHKNTPKITQLIKPNLLRLKTGMSLLHPSVFIPRRFYEWGGGYRTDLKVAMDYDLLLRFFKLGFEYFYLDEHLAEMSDGGVSEKNRKLGLQEVEQIRRAHGLNFSYSKMLYFYELTKSKTGSLIKKILPSSYCAKFPPSGPTQFP